MKNIIKTIKLFLIGIVIKMFNLFQHVKKIKHHFKPKLSYHNNHFKISNFENHSLNYLGMINVNIYPSLEVKGNISCRLVLKTSEKEVFAQATKKVKGTLESPTRIENYRMFSAIFPVEGEVKSIDKGLAPKLVFLKK